MSKLSYCRKCGEVLDGSSFCSNCGVEVNPSGFSDLDDFTNEKPMMMIQEESWNKEGLLSSTIKMHTSPESVATELLQDPNSPSTAILVVIFAILTSILTTLTLLKTQNVYAVPEEWKSQLEGRSSPINTFVSAFVVILIGWWVGSWIMAKIFERSFPKNTPLSHNATAAMRKLNGYRYGTGIIALTIQIIILYFQPTQIATYRLQDTIFGSVPLPTYEGFTSFYLISSIILTVIYIIISLLVLYRGLSVNGYSGLFIYVIIGWKLIFNIYPLLKGI